MEVGSRPASRAATVDSRVPSEQQNSEVLDLSASVSGEDEEGEGEGEERNSEGAVAEPSALPTVGGAYAHLASGQFQEAINEYSELLRGSAGSTERARLLLGRSAAYAEFAERLRRIPASQSESHAIYAPDPFHLARLALKDAQASEQEAPSCLATVRQGDALFLFEHFLEARRAYRRAAQQLPDDGAEPEPAGAVSALLPLAPSPGGLARYLEDRLEACGAALQGALGSVLVDEEERERALQDVECTLCMRLLWEPVTTCCGHTYCRPCIARAADHGNRCPMCRVVLHLGPDPPVTVVLRALLQRSFPREYEARGIEEAQEPAGAEQGAQLPLFVMSPMLPGERMALNIFEPRYRLMVRRCMEGSRRFGMACVDRTHQLHEVACEAEITECNALPDGRFYLEIVGRRRFQPLDPQEQDGYRVARAQYLRDDPVAPESPAADAQLALCSKVEAAAASLVERLQSLGQTRRGVAELLQRLGDKPTGGDAEELSFWAANAVCSILDDPSLKLRMLSSRCTAERLGEACSVLLQLASSQGKGCTIM